MTQLAVIVHRPRDVRDLAVAAAREEASEPPDRFASRHREREEVAERAPQADRPFREHDGDPAARDPADHRLARLAAHRELHDVRPDQAAEQAGGRDGAQVAPADAAPPCSPDEQREARGIRQNVRDARQYQPCCDGHGVHAGRASPAGRGEPPFRDRAAACAKVALRGSIDDAARSGGGGDRRGRRRRHRDRGVPDRQPVARRRILGDDRGGLRVHRVDAHRARARIRARSPCRSGW